MNNSFKIRYNVVIETFNVYTKKIVSSCKVHNLIVNTGLNKVANLIGGLASTGFQYLAIGQNNTIPVAGNTTLGSEVKRHLVTPTLTGTGILHYDYTFTFGSGEIYTINECGLFDASSFGIMLNRAVFIDQSVDVDNNLRIKITLTIVNS